MAWPMNHFPVSFLVDADKAANCQVEEAVVKERIENSSNVVACKVMQVW